MKLTDNEKRGIIKLLEADKPLPDEYRFLLFDGKRAVELTGVSQEVMPGRRKIGVKVADIFGNDTMTIVEVTV